MPRVGIVPMMLGIVLMLLLISPVLAQDEKRSEERRGVDLRSIPGIIDGLLNPREVESRPAPTADTAPPDGFEAAVRRDYENLREREISFPQYLEFRNHEERRLMELKRNQRVAYHPVIGQKTPCGNGDFETGLNVNEWQGAYGTVPLSGNPNFPTFTDGIVGGPITAPTSRQTLVGPGGTDPNVGIPLTAPGSTHAVRIGNSATGFGSELLSKTLVVTPAQCLFSFWYAVVFQDPGHSPTGQPSFWVRITDHANGVELPNVVNLGNGTAKVVADGANPFFQTAPGGNLLYRNWSCAQIDLSQHIGKTVTIEFVTEDCAHGAHYGYAYVDRFCGDCAGAPTGSLTFSSSSSSACGVGKLCFEFTLPRNATTGALGTANITLGIFQNGALLTSYASQTLTGGKGICFNITPASIPGINMGAGGFDFVATGVFSIAGAPSTSMVVGVAPYGQSQTPGVNDDYRIVCAPGPGTSKWCCPGTNLVNNGDFESPPIGHHKPPNWPSIGSSYSASPSIGPGGVLPGYYSVVTGDQALAICSNWSVADHSTCDTGSGHVMVINGKTGQTPGRATIWSQTVAVVPGREYRFCANVKNLSQCCFNVYPSIDVLFTGPGNVPIAAIPPSGPIIQDRGPCHWRLISTSFVVPAGVTSLTIDIGLDQSALGDGNDLALDDISLQEKPQVPASFVGVNLATTTTSSGQYTVTASYPAGLPTTPQYGYLWGVCEIDNSGNSIAGTVISNPSAWWTWPGSPAPNTFNGYVGTTNLGPLSNPGIFQPGKRYRITFAAWSDCEAIRFATWELQFNTRSHRSPQVTQVERRTPDPLFLPQDLNRPSNDSDRPTPPLVPERDRRQRR